VGMVFMDGYEGDIVTCPDWNPIPKCGNGLHGLLEGNGNWILLEGIDWLVIEAETEDIVNIDEHKCKFRTGKILFRGSRNELKNSEFKTKLNLNEDAAYQWTKFIGNHDLMINKIESSYYAYLWALTFGDRDIMKPKITDPQYINLWNYQFPYDKITLP